MQDAPSMLRLQTNREKKWTRYTIFRIEIFHQPLEMDSCKKKIFYQDQKMQHNLTNEQLYLITKWLFSWQLFHQTI